MDLLSAVAVKNFTLENFMHFIFNSGYTVQMDLVHNDLIFKLFSS